MIEKLGFAPDPVLVAGRYQLRRRIGRGGFGTVYEALDVELDRLVAVKVLDSSDPAVALREGVALAKLEHPNVVRIYDHGQCGDFRFIVLQLLDGPSLKEWCVNKSSTEIVEKYLEAARGLDAAHQAGLVHRDFKPSNVRIGSSGQAVVVDFGLARGLHVVEESDKHVLAGTLAYVAPERLRGDPGDARADQFSFCAALWEALAGEHPYGPCYEHTTSDARIAAIKAGRRGVPRGAKHVVQAIERGLAIEPDERFGTVRGLVESIEKIRRRPDLVLVAAGTALMTFAVGLTSLLPNTSTATTGWITDCGDRVALESAVAAASMGDSAEALQVLERAHQAKPSESQARTLAEASSLVAANLDAHGLAEDAVLAWGMAVHFARISGDEDLEENARRRIRATRR